MKKVKVLLVGLLTMVMCLFCFVGCGEKGVYKVTEYKVGPASVEVTDSESYIELKGDNVATMSIDVAKVVTLEGEGTWAKGEEKNSYIVTIENVEYPVTIVDGEMTVEILGTKLVLVKE